MSEDLYADLGINRAATDTEIRRTYRSLITKLHPDKAGGDPVAFAKVHKAYEVLSNAPKRRLYDATGKVEKSAGEEFVSEFGGGKFKDAVRDGELMSGGNGAGQGLADQIITTHESGDVTSHSAGFEAWVRSRGGSSTATVMNAESIAEQFGVVRSSYEPVPIPEEDACVVRCKGAGPPRDSVAMSSEALPRELEWGQVLLRLRFAAISPGDTYSARLGGIYGSDSMEPPFVMGHEGVFVVAMVGPGVKSLREGDTALPLRPFLGTWSSALVAKEKDVLRLPLDTKVSCEHLALVKEMCVAYRLLEDYGNLKPGDCIILNAANSTVGQIVLQLAALLRLRVVAVARDGGRGDWDRFSAWLRSLGASEVLKDEGSLKVELERAKFFARPKLALDSVGGDSGLRLAEALAEGGEIVIYGCASGKAPAWPWQNWVFKGQKVSGFSFARWMTGNRTKYVHVIESMAKLLAAHKLQLNYTEYDLLTEFPEALEHAMDSGKNTKVLLRGPAWNSPLAQQ